jgi:hypothetical protein
MPNQDATREIGNKCRLSGRFVELTVGDAKRNGEPEDEVQYSLNDNDVTFLKRVTRFAPLQFFGQPTDKNDHSQFLKLFLPLLGLNKKEINFRIRSVH